MTLNGLNNLDIIGTLLKIMMKEIVLSNKPTPDLNTLMNILEMGKY
jgi:hypothetical protein